MRNPVCLCAWWLSIIHYPPAANGLEESIRLDWYVGVERLPGAEFQSSNPMRISRYQLANAIENNKFSLRVIHWEIEQKLPFYELTKYSTGALAATHL